MKIAVVTPSFFPATAFGGPIFSTYMICNALAKRTDVNLRVITTDAAGPRPGQRLAVANFPVRYDGYDVYFTRRVAGTSIAPSLLYHLVGMTRWADVIYLNGTYSMPTIPTLTCAKLLDRPVLWSPRGALLASYSWRGASHPKLKRAWERACIAAMPERMIHLVTSPQEAEASKARIPGARTVTIPNGIDIPPPLDGKTWRAGGTLRIMFLGRLDAIKAIDAIIEALALITDDSTELHIYGSGDQGYLDSLKSLAAQHNVADRVRFYGHVEDEGKRAAFANSDICILASQTENFGMVVAEALAHGVPVIVSRGTPWSGVEAKGCGLWVPNTPESLAAAITVMSRRDLATMGNSGRQWMREAFGWERIAAQVYDVLDELVTQM